MRLFLITVNYNGADRTIPFINALQAQTDQDFELIIVDNASTAFDVQRIESVTAGTKFQLVRNAENLGFSGGNNVGIRIALEKGADWVILVNNDTEHKPTFLSRLRANLEQIEGIGALPIQEGERTAYGGRIAWLQQTLKHSYTLTSSLQLQASSYLYAIGAGVAIPRQVFEKIGFLDERYFLYFEDADFSARAWNAGIPVTPLKEPVVYHYVSATTRSLGTARLLRYHARNSLLFNWKNAPWWVAVLLPFWSLYGIIFQSLKILLMPSRRSHSRAIAAGIVDFYAGKFGYIEAEN